MIRFSRTVRAALIAGALLAPATLALVSSTARAQANETRSVTGEVLDKSGNKIKGAVVHLKDTRALTQRSYITADDGVFRFAQLSTGTDYELWATQGDTKSASRTISSFDNKKALEVSLKMP